MSPLQIERLLAIPVEDIPLFMADAKKSVDLVFIMITGASYQEVHDSVTVPLLRDILSYHLERGN